MAIVGIVSDLHAPFEQKGYLEFVKDTFKKFKVDTIVFIGDELDHHAISNFSSDPDGMSPGDELKAAIEHLKPWYKAFPNAKVCQSNHTDRPYRKAKEMGLPRAYFKEYRDWLQAPEGWEWAEKFEIDGVKYTHGTGFSGANAALKACEKNRQSVVLGHVHTFASIQFSATDRDLLWGMNVGTGLDVSYYAFAYGKEYSSRPVVSCGVVVDGRQPYLITMDLGSKVKSVKNSKVKIVNNKTLLKGKSVLTRHLLKEELKKMKVNYSEKSNTSRLRSLYNKYK